MDKNVCCLQKFNYRILVLFQNINLLNVIKERMINIV